MRTQLEVADVFREYGAQYRQTYRAGLSPRQSQAMRAIQRCRTAEMGGHIDECTNCGYQRPSYNSCRDRHCPKCQSLARARWIEARKEDLLPVVYFHVVFTLPSSIAALALQNKRVIYNLLFRTVAKTLRVLAADPKHLGAVIGFFGVLHTWGQQLNPHPHIHCVVPGGGLSLDGTRWIACKRSSKGKDFFISVKVMSSLFRRLFCESLRELHKEGDLNFYCELAHLADAKKFDGWLKAVSHTKWVVYAKKPFGGPAQVIEYLGRYTHRVAISNSRLIKLEDGEVHFRWRDYRHGNEEKLMKLNAVDFIGRFLLHVLPPGFVRIRHFGLLANCHSKAKVTQCRELLGVAVTEALLPKLPVDWKRLYELLTGESVDRCPKCKTGLMTRVVEIPRLQIIAAVPRESS